MDARFVLLLACFFVSGFAALLYQTAWTRELSFVFGTSELAVAAVLAAYMGGLALGAAAAARFALRLRRPVLAYGVLELAIALCALSVPTGIRLINAIYVGLLGGGSDLVGGGATVASLFQLGAAFAVLLPPTAFMGATLPLLARHAVRNEAEIGSRVGVLYAVNTAGAIAGTVFAAFWLMPELGLRHTVWVGAALNGLVFALAALLASKALLPAIALSGAVSFAYEVLWTRLLGQVLGGSLDAFATMLASFLLGITLGSALAARLSTSRERAALGFGVSQLGIALTSYAAFALADRLPELSLLLGAGPGAPLASAGVAAAALLPITLCIGATFPFAVRLLARSEDQAALATARTYAWNTMGAIVGALGAGFVLLPQLGFEGTLGVGVAANLGLAALAALSLRPRRTRLAAVAAVAGVVLIALPPQPPWRLLRSSPLNRNPDHGEIRFAAVGRSATVLLFSKQAHFRLTSNGLPESRIEARGSLPLAAVAHWLCLLPSLVRPEARDLLVVGLGGGVALEPIVSTVESVDVIELEPEVLAANQWVADRRAIDPLVRPGLRVHVGDARGVLQLTGRHYDAVVSQPSHPWTAGASHLYTREFFSMVRSRLKPDGVFVQWIGLGFVDEALLRSLAATLVDVFPHVEIYQPGGTNGILFAASAEPLALIEGTRRALQLVPADYARFGIHRVEDVAAARVLDSAGTRALAQGGALNTDDHNLLASRASRLGDSSLDGDSVRRFWKLHDPLLAEIDDLDRFALIRRLIARNFKQRANAVALAEAGALRETGLGWVELGFGRAGRAVRHFSRALELAPGSSEALAGLVAMRSIDSAERRSAAGIAERDLAPPLLALIRGWRHAALNQWAEVAKLDAELSRIAPGEALFAEATRLRIRWRLITGRAQSGAEAQALAETLLSRNWGTSDALLRARAALAAGRPEAAWGSLHRILGVMAANRQAGEFPSVSELVAELPDALARDLRGRLEGSPPADRSRPGGK